jgi:bla regulator protein BlaR1
MPALFVFLIKVNLSLVVFCLGYYLVLRKLTFYNLNRFYLVAAIICSSVYPLIDLNDFMSRHQEIVAPVDMVVINWQSPRDLIEHPAYWQWIIKIFWLGTIVFAARLAIQFLSLYKLYRNSKPDTIGDHQVRITNANISPFSFWQHIYINPGNVALADLNSILEHERVHVKQWHTLDILLTELSVIFYWFNPGVWLMKKAVRENIEFITDRAVLQNGTNSKAYQYSLLNVRLTGTTQAGIANHFNFSTLKKRIKMMNTKKSSNLNLARYAVLVPMVVALLMVFSFSKAELIKENREQLKHLITQTINREAGIDTKLIASSKATVRLTKANSKTTIDTVTILNTQVQYVRIKGIDLPIGVPSRSVLNEIHNTVDTNVTVAIKKGGRSNSDSIIINGKVATEAELAKLAPGIKNIHVTQANNVAGKVVRVKVNGEVKTVQYPVSFSFKYDTDSDTTYKPGKITNNRNVNVTEFTAVGDKVKLKDGNVNITSSKITFNADKASQPTTISDKLTIIDGEEATEKTKNKLPVSKIEKIQIKDGGKEMTDKYGDKAKNGVVIITTKKDK